jgi:predicted NBD/HSP70 family sugar kinase
VTTLGIDIGGTSIKMAVVREERVGWTGRSEPYKSPSSVQLVQVLERMIEALPADTKKADAVAACVPGMLDWRRMMVTASVNLPGVVGVLLGELIAASMGLPPRRVFGLTDMHATALDLYASRGLRGRLLVLAIGAGVGAAVYDEHGPLRVEGESPGHIGQCDVSLEGEPVIGPDGGAGSLEGYLGAEALLRRYGPRMGADLSFLTAQDVPLRALARAIRICHAIYCPEHVCLAGGIGIRLGHLLAPLKASIDANLTRVARPGWTLTAGDTDFHASRGAARFAAQEAARMARAISKASGTNRAAHSEPTERKE